MNYDVLINFDVLFWIQLIVALFFGILMINDSKRYKEDLFKLLIIVFVFIIAKSIVSIAINFTTVYYTKGSAVGSGIELWNIDKAAEPLFNLRFMIWHYFELLVVVVLYYIFATSRKKAENLKTSGLMIFTVLQIVLATAIIAAVVFFSMQDSVKIDTMAKKGPKLYEAVSGIVIPKAKVEFFNLFNEVIGKWIFAVWRVALLIMTWLSVSSIYGYLANVLKSIHKYKGFIYAYLVIEIIFALFSAMVPYYAQTGWFVIQAISTVIFGIYAFNVHTEYISSVQGQVVDLEKQRDIIINLMRDVSAIVGSGDFDLDTVVKQIVDSSVQGTSARGGAVLLKDNITNRLMVKYVKGMYPPTKQFKISSGMALTESMIVEKFKAEKIAIGEGLIGTVAEGGDTVYIPDATKSKRFVQTIPEHMLVTSFVAVPLKSKEDVFGVLTMVDDSRTFLASDVRLLETLGEQAAITIKQIQMYQEILEKKQAEKEVGVAAEIQTSLVPHEFPETNKYEIYAFSIAAKGVGGDYYDYIDFGNNKIVVTMFDVSGKGVPAALIMVMIRSILRTIATLDEETKDVISRLNNTAAQDIVEDRYATGFYLLFDAEKGIMSYTNAGHGPLVLYRAKEDRFEFLDTEGMPVGIMTDVEYGMDYTTLAPGDIACLYTDGVTEAMNANHEEYGMERFQEIIRKYRRESAREICNKVLEDTNRFMAGSPLHDDETLLILKTK